MGIGREGLFELGMWGNIYECLVSEVETGVTTRNVLELDNCVAGIRIIRVPKAPPERIPLVLSSTLRNC